jgi:hypothetical protein
MKDLTIFLEADSWTTSYLAGRKPPIDPVSGPDNFRIARQPGVSAMDSHKLTWSAPELR